MIKKIILLIVLFNTGVCLLFSDNTNEEALEKILEQAISIYVDSKIVIQESDIDLQSEITKVTIPGRTITLLYEGENEKLSIQLTPFKSDDGSYLLTALSSLWIEGDNGAKFRSSFKSIKLQENELVLFYPLGLKTQEALSGGTLQMELGLKVSPYVHQQEEQSE